MGRLVKAEEETGEVAALMVAEMMDDIAVLAMVAQYGCPSGVRECVFDVIVWLRALRSVGGWCSVSYVGGVLISCAWFMCQSK